MRDRRGNLLNTATDDKPRFAFGENWQAFLRTVDEQRIEQAMRSLSEMLGSNGDSTEHDSFQPNSFDLQGKRFLDIGCGSGLFSLAARRLGADVVSIDFDADCVGCTEELRRRYSDNDEKWTVLRGSVLDESMMSGLGTFDVVYSWGVLHHTGDMASAIRMAADRVESGGLFFIAIYNDQGGASRRWLTIKKIYQRLPRCLRPAWVAFVAGIYEIKFSLARLARLQNPLPLADWQAKKHDRGMSAWYDWVDWIGGLPFEVAKPEAIIVPLRRRGFVLQNLKTVGCGWGCNEFVFQR